MLTLSRLSKSKVYHVYHPDSCTHEDFHWAVKCWVLDKRKRNHRTCFSGSSGVPAWTCNGSLSNSFFTFIKYKTEAQIWTSWWHQRKRLKIEKVQRFNHLVYEVMLNISWSFQCILRYFRLDDSGWQGNLICTAHFNKLQQVLQMNPLKAPKHKGRRFKNIKEKTSSLSAQYLHRNPWKKLLHGGWILRWRSPWLPPSNLLNCLWLFSQIWGVRQRHCRGVHARLPDSVHQWLWDVRAMQASAHQQLSLCSVWMQSR